MCKRKRLHYVLWYGTGLVLLLILGAGVLPVGLELLVRSAENGDSVLVLPLEPMECFTLHYIHSVDQAPIWEVHSVDASGNIYIEEERFVMFGAGMGHWNGHGTLTKRGSYQVIENIHEPVGNFLLRVGSPSSHHSIIWRNTRIDLSRQVAGLALRISAQPVSLLKYICRMICTHSNTAMATGSR